MRRSIGWRQRSRDRYDPTLLTEGTRHAPSPVRPPEALRLTSASPAATATPSPQITATVTVTPPPTLPDDAKGAEPVTFQADDGTELIGRLWEAGDVGVVLAHGFSPMTGQDDWPPYPDALVERGYSVLTFNFRGFCSAEGCSGDLHELGNNWRDVIAAVDFLESRGVDRVFVVGASMGGIAVLRAARTPGVDVAGVISLATPQFPSRYYPPDEPQANDLTPARLRAIDEPKLFVAGDRDVQELEGVEFAKDARSMFEASNEPKELAIVPSTYHSSQLVTAAEEDVIRQTRQIILRFIEEHA